MRYSNLHTHTVFSDGADTVEANIKSAIEKNMLSLGISDHSYTPFDTSYCIQRERIDEYKAEVRRQRELYRDKIEVYLGLELDGFAQICDREDYDYVIGDCHYLPTADGYKPIDVSRSAFVDVAQKYFNNDTVEMAVSYYRSYAETVYPMRPDVLGHIDLINKYGLVDESDARYVAAAKEALSAVLEVSSVVELNTGAIARGYKAQPYPADFILEQIKKKGGKILLSSDSHSAKNLTFWFDEAKSLLLGKGIRSIVVYTDGGFKEVGIE